MIRGPICIYIPKLLDRLWNSPSLMFNKVLVIKANEMHYFSTVFGKELYMFRTDLLSIIRSLNTVFTTIGMCCTSYVAVCLNSLADGNITSMTNTYRNEHGINPLNAELNPVCKFQFAELFCGVFKFCA